MLKIILTSIFAFLVLLGCDDGKRGTPLSSHAIEERHLKELLIEIEGLPQDTNPANVSEWIKQNSFQEMLRTSDVDDILADEWGNQILVLYDTGEVVALASRGANGVWDNGKHDDIIVSR